MRKSCIDCKYYERGCIPSNPKVYMDCEQSAENNIHSFEWADSRLKAAEHAMSVLWRLAHECYYKSDGTPPMYYGLEEDMMSEYETCLDIMGEGEVGNEEVLP